MTLIEKQRAFLDETIAFYNSTNRGTSEGGGCKYYVEGKEGCAIGRKIADKELCKKLDKSKNGSGIGLEWVFCQLPTDLQELGQDFLKAVQLLHDDSNNWNETGLSGVGTHKANLIRKDFGL